MTRRPLIMALALGALTFAACGEDTNPTQPGTANELSPGAPSLLTAASNTWTVRAAFSDNDQFGVAAGATTNSAGHSIVYVFGGTNSEDGGTESSIRAYDVATNTWTGTFSDVSVFNTNGVGRIGSTFYYSGGYDRSGGELVTSLRLIAYDPVNDRSTVKADLPKAIADGVTGVINGNLYVLAGTCSGEFWPDPRYCGGASENSRRLFRYHPNTNSWASKAWSPHFHKNGAGGVINGKFYVAGGTDDKGRATANLDVYDPANNTWKTLAPIPAARAFPSGAVLQGQLYVIGSGSTTYAYDPATNKWRSRAALPDTRVGFAAVQVTLDGRPRILVVGGTSTAGEPPKPSLLYTP
jgi:N-acetylneuraminic acid mutarotase